MLLGYNNIPDSVSVVMGPLALVSSLTVAANCRLERCRRLIQSICSCRYRELSTLFVNAMLENDPIRLESANFCLDFLGSLCVYSVN